MGQKLISHFNSPSCSWRWGPIFSGADILQRDPIYISNFASERWKQSCCSLYLRMWHSNSTGRSQSSKGIFRHQQNHYLQLISLISIILHMVTHNYRNKWGGTKSKVVWMGPCDVSIYCGFVISLWIVCPSLSPPKRENQFNDTNMCKMMFLPPLCFPQTSVLLTKNRILHLQFESKQRISQ